MSDETFPIVKLDANTKLPPVKLNDILSEMGISGPRIAAKELVDQTFTIVHAKPFASTYREGAHAWFCVIYLPDDTQPYTTVLGGQAVVDVLDALASAGFENPLIVTLRKVDGGRFGSYYVLE